MYCGERCPACFGGMDGEYCQLLELENNVKDISHDKFSKLSLSDMELIIYLRDQCAVNGGYCAWYDCHRMFYDRWSGAYSDDGDYGEYQGDPCIFNISKYMSRF